MELSCEIKYLDDSETLIVNNFYQVIFLESDFKTIIIYTAVVYCTDSGTIKNDKILEIKFSSEVIPIKEYDFINFDINDIKNPEKMSPLQKVWGDFTGLIKNPTDLENAYVESSIQNKNNPPISQFFDRELKEDEIYSIGMKGNKKGVSCVAVLHKGTSENGKLNIWHGGNSSLPKNVSIMNLSKIKLHFESSPVSKYYKYTIRQASGSNFLFEDFSLYVIPPLIFEVDTNHSRIELHNDKTKASIDEKDSISPVGKNGDAYFHDWERLDIMSRNVYRITSSTVKNVTELNKYDTLAIEFKLHSSRLDILFRAFIGIYLSFMLAFVVDKTRISIVEKHFYFNGYIPLDIFCIIICISIFALYLITIFHINRNIECKYGDFIKLFMYSSAFIFFILYFWIFQISASVPLIYSFVASFVGLMPISGLFGLLFFIFIKKGFTNCYNFKLLKAFFNK